MESTQNLLDLANKAIEIRNNPTPLAYKIRRIFLKNLGFEISGVADFMHANPLIPSREITGMYRLLKVNDFLESRNCPHLLNIIYDTPLPLNEMMREQGGIGLRFGFLNRTVQIINDKEKTLGADT